MVARAELSSIASSLQDLAVRVAAMAEGLAATESDEVGPELFEVERSLRAAGRRLDRLLDR